ncbi:hypothetical protein ASPZODRAFT_163562 [Penicilliopsis zonata CBS 506.65]|uniref:Oxidase ustYa n=1 Tax=Penicilliopsis zonata CBS 506.65 TaxID=1073090 RepID=A0A1L9SX52_9EURO|nr:hypothetical protein ASPZODRAFT_163562 [Penicilliopsis zonata CBS 506.65]OJJ51778.1 hypothetical protein ASPZODRAFT_163562 [Penicilliopsis zonata CBS 506.65]
MTMQENLPTYWPLSGNEDDNDEQNWEEKISPRPWNRVFSYKRAFWALSCFVVVGLIFGMVQYPRSKPVELGSERFFPMFKHRRVTFFRAGEFEHSVPAQENSPWPKLLPEGSFGFVKVTNPRYYNITGGLPLDVETNAPTPELYREPRKENETEIYVISMFHQLHCLIMMRDTLMRVNDQGKVVAGTSMPEEMISNDHLNHCFDYIRQAILCAGDTALDRYAFDDSGPELLYAVNGLGTTHICRDTDAIYEFESQHAWKRHDMAHVH